MKSSKIVSMDHTAEHVPAWYLSQEEDKVAHSVYGGHLESILHQDEESVTGGGAEAGAVDGCRSVSILKIYDMDMLTVDAWDLESTVY